MYIYFTVKSQGGGGGKARLRGANASLCTPLNEGLHGTSCSGDSHIKTCSVAVVKGAHSFLLTAVLPVYLNAYRHVLWEVDTNVKTDTNVHKGKEGERGLGQGERKGGREGEGKGGSIKLHFTHSSMLKKSKSIERREEEGSS